MNGVFLLDAVRDGAFVDPVTYGERYYARYPALSIPHHYPPLFHLTEACFYWVFGVSAFTARFCVLVFHVGAVLILFELVNQTYDTACGLLAAILFATCPVVLLWSRQVMLEPPTVFLMLLATLLLLRVEDRPTAWNTTLWAVAVSACLLCKQTGAMIVPAHFGYLLLKHGRDVFRHRPLAVAFALVGLVVLGLAAYTLVFSQFQIRVLTTGTLGQRLTWSHLSFYPSLLPQVLGWPLLAASTIGVVFALWRWRGEERALLHLTWAAAFYAMMVCLLSYTARYAYMWVPPFAVLGGYGLVELHRCIRNRWLQGLAAVGFSLAIVGQVAAVPPQVVTGHEAAAKYVAQLPGGATIMVDSVWDGDFVFYSRVHDPSRRIVLRGSKSLYTFASVRWVGFQSMVNSEEEINDFLREHGTRYVVVDSGDVGDAAAATLLRNALSKKSFRRLARFPVSAEHTRIVGDYIDVYEFLDAQEPTTDEIELRFPGLQRRIRVPLNELMRDERSRTFGATRRLRNELASSLICHPAG